MWQVEVFILFQCDAEKTLYAYKSYGDDYWINEYVKFSEEDDHLIETEILTFEREPDYENVVDGYLNTIDKYTYFGKEIAV